MMSEGNAARPRRCLLRYTRSWWLLAAAGLTTTLVVGVGLLVLPDGVWTQVMGRWGQALAQGAGAAGCALCARRLRGPARLTWGLFAIGEGIWALTDLSVGFALLAGNDPGEPSVFDITWLAFYVPMLAGTLLLYGPLRPGNRRGVLDVALVGAAIALWGWVLLLAPAAAGASGGRLGVAVNLLYPICDLLCLGTLGWVIGRHVRDAPPWLWWVVAAFGLGLAADLAYLLASLNGHEVAGGLSAAAYMVAGWLWALAAERRRSWPAGLWDAGEPAAPPAWSEAVPLVCGLGVVGLVAANDGPIGALVIGVLVLAVARVVMTYLANRRLIAERRLQEERLRLLVSEQAALRRVAEAVANEMDSPGVFALVAQEVARLFEVDCGLVWRFEEAHAQAVGSFGDALIRAGHRIELTGTGAAPTVARTSASARASYALEGAARSDLVRHGIASPVVVGGSLWGCVHVAVTQPGSRSPFGDTSCERLQCFAELVGLALANAETRLALETRASTDPLTGLANHRFFQERLGEEWERARRQDGDLALVLIDLDHFKRVNDTFGHPAGDGVLIELARRLRRATRSHDILARVGGEEFAWVLPGATEAEAIDASERARALIRDGAFPGVGALTASFGVCHASAAAGPNELQQMADEALYSAKRTGRDRVTSYSAELPGSQADLDPEAIREHLRHQTAGGVLGLARAVDARDPATRRHSGRVADLSVQLATALGWELARCVALRDAGLMHDVGKIGVPDGILLKPGRLTADEYEIVKTHAAIGAAIVADVLSPEQVSWVRHHHERVDGSGYPDALAGDAIPEGARILAVADSVDVMTSPRSYASGSTLDEAVEECLRCAGSQFDPRVVAALARLVEVGAIAPPAAAGVLI
jgi:diguanylate cyclase (GGDEF)-like protein